MSGISSVYNIENYKYNNSLYYNIGNKSIILPPGTIFKGEQVIMKYALLSDNGAWSNNHLLFRENYSNNLVDLTHFVEILI